MYLIFFPNCYAHRWECNYRPTSGSQMHTCVSSYLWHGPIHPADRPLPAEDRSRVPDYTYDWPRAHARERLLSGRYKQATNRRSRRLWWRPSAPPTAPTAAPGAIRTTCIEPRPPTPHLSTSRAPVHPKQAKTRVRMNACKAISALSRAFRAAGGRLRTSDTPRSVPVEPLLRLARQAEPRRVGDAKSGRIASMQNMLAARPTVGRIDTC